MARILCVEDEPEIRADLVEELSDCGHTVASATNGDEGIQVAVSFRPEIIVSDCLMPVMTGTEMLITLRQCHPEFAAIPFVFLSAHAESAHVEHGKAAGADSYLTKPVDFDLLLETLEQLLAKDESLASDEGSLK